MTESEVAQWKHERDIARAISDEDERKIALQKVYDLRDDLQMRCIQHQADRIKKCLAKDEKMEADIEEIKRDLSPCKESDVNFRNMQMQAQGMKKLLDLLKILAGAGGGAFLARLFGS